MVNIGKLKQVWDMRKAAKTMKSALSDILVTGEAVNKQIKVSMDGNQKVTAIDLAPELLKSDNKTVIEQGLVEAQAKAQKKLQEIMAAKVRSGELEIPDLKM